ncbi:protein PfhB2 [Actinobacillus equuli]|nr:protein PfhB2 [Actinobacillus equuli]
MEKYLVLLLTGVTLPAFAEPSAVVDEQFKDKTTIAEQKQRVVKVILIIDIAKPEADGVSDNRFSKFNVPNSAVFNNSLADGKSQLGGDLKKNQHFDKEAAKAILSQVTGSEMSKIQGGLEVFGQKADLIIVNPNGIELNGVKTINSDRFVAAAANVTEKGKYDKLTTSKGKVVIGANGVATNGLSYFDVVAKTIEQKGTIGPEKDTKNHPTANITFAAGNLDYDLKTRDIKARENGTGNKFRIKSKDESEIAISGELAGAMYGKNIQFITTDSGAGVNHKGTILSEQDIKIATKEGSITVQKVHANKIAAEGKNFEVAQKGLVRANEI